MERGGYERQGLIPWALQRLTGALLFIFIGGHFMVTHYTGRIDFQHVADRLSQLRPWFWFDILLVTCVAFHAVNGLRNIFLDYNPSRKWLRAANVAAVLLIVLIVAVCAYHLTAFAG